FAGRGLSIYDPETNTVDFRGNFPDGMRAGGDLTYREGRFYMITSENQLVEVDIANPANVNIIKEFPDSIPPIHGLATFPFQCDSIDTYAFAQHETGTTIYYLDFEDFSLTQVCEYPDFNFDAATTEECILPPCEIFVDLDQDDSAGTVGNDCTIYACQLPAPIGDTDIQVFSPYKLDSIHIQLTDIIDVGEEYLSTTANNSVQTIGNNSTAITLINTGPAEYADFEAALRNMRFNDEATNPTFGPRQVSIQLFSSFYTALPTISTIILTDQNGNLALNALVEGPSCTGFSDAEVALSGSGNIGTFTFLWEDGTDSLKRQSLLSGSYNITLTDGGGCVANTSFQILEADSIRIELSGNEEAFCGPIGTISAIVQGGVTPYSYLWEDDSSSPERTDLLPGAYTLVVTDSNACEATASYTLELADTLFTEEFVEACLGTTVEIAGSSYSQDTNVIQTFSTLEGCDSIHQTYLSFLDTNLVLQHFELCNGETFSIEDLTFEQDTTFYFILTNENGCDSTLVIDLDVIAPTGYTQAEICEGETFELLGTTYTQAGTYEQLISRAEQCDSTLIIDVVVHPNPIPSIEREGELCDEGIVNLSIVEYARMSWSNGTEDSSMEVLSEGEYSVTVVDEEGCSGSATIVIQEEMIELFLSSTNPTCAEEFDGMILMDSIVGGTPPFLFSIDDSVLEPIANFNNLPAGTYHIEVEDANGCRTIEIITLTAPEPLQVTFPLERVELKLGDSIQLAPIIVGNPTQLQWNTDGVLGCDTCEVVLIQPYETTTYQLSVANASNTCSASASMTVFVDTKSGIYIPNVFSPNGDGFNDAFYVLSDHSIQRVVRFNVFDRWGNQVFAQLNMLPNVEDDGWDGTFKGEALNAGIYIYQIELETIAGERKLVQGDILLTR
ncbi:MAG: gliding motility-associated C-terminal domain-containing protein, partial [Bacteroidota bacterium]